MRLIDADALKEVLGDTRDGEPVFRETEFIRMDIVEKSIDDAPTLPNPCGKPCAFIRPHGEWKEVYLTPEEKCFYGELWECSICRVKDKKSNFCPNCGASMISSNSEIEKSKSKICPCIDCCKLDNSETCRKGCSDYQKWKEGEAE